MCLLLAACSGRIDDGAAGDGPGAPAGSAPTTRTATPPSTAAAARGCRPAPRRVWKLTADQLARSYDALLGLQSGAAARLRPLQPETRLFSNEADALAGSANTVSELFNVASDLAAKAVAQPSQLHPCLASQLASDACIKSFVTDFGARAFRRPLEADEQKDYLDFFTAEAAKYGRIDGVRQVVRRFLVSPAFLFRSELGAGQGNVAGPLTPYETAAAMSYFLLDGPPDAPLVAAAASGALASRDERVRQVQRLLAAPATAGGIMKMVGEYIDVDKVAPRAPADIKNRAAVVASMADEPARFTQNVLWQDDHKLATLIDARYAVLDATLVAHYGLSGKPNGWDRVALGDRPGGLLAQGAPLVARPGTTARGVYIRERLLCQKAPDPPGTAETDLDKIQKQFEAKAGAKLTRRQVREQHMADPGCKSCHSLLDPLGFPFDNFDEAGRWQATVDGQPVDTRGQIIGTPHTDGPVTDARDMLGKMAASPDVGQCFVQHLYTYVNGRAVSDDDGCYLQGLNAKFQASGGDLIGLVADMLAADGFVQRSPMGDN